jgi:predicted kinase
VRDVPVVAVLVGLQASGKTTFCRDVLGERYVQVSKDHFPNARNRQRRQLRQRRQPRQRRQLRLLREALAAGHDVVIDNTNPSPTEWQPLIETARNCGAGLVGYWFPPDLAGSLARNAARAGRARVPEIGVMSTVSRLRQPGTADGFDSVLTVRFDGSGGFEVSLGPAEVPGGR